MKEKFINSSINFIQKYQECDDLKIIKLKYGLEGIYGLFIKLITCVTISIILDTFTETCLFLLFYAGLRSFSYGMHAKNSLACWFVTIIIYNIIPLLIKDFNISRNIGYIVLIIAFLSMALWAPADTPKKPLIRKSQRKKCKIFSLITVILYFLIYYFSKNIIVNNAILYALIVQIVFINPLTYKVTKTQFNNYKYYKKNN